jgi:hypothetical protein
LRKPVLNLLEEHFCAHPLLPGYSALSPKGIKVWAMI